MSRSHHQRPSTPSGDRRRLEHGAAASELAIAVPALLTLLLLIVQFGLWLHAGHLAAAAAQDAAAAARVHHGSAQAGHVAAAELLDSLGARLLQDRRVTVTRTADTVRVEVTARTVAVLPGLRPPVRALVERPVERFRPADQESRAPQAPPPTAATAARSPAGP